MSISRINADVTFFKLLSVIQNDNPEIIAQALPFLIRTACLNDAKVLADLLTISFHPQDGWMQYFNPILRLGIYEDLRHRIQSRSLPYACVIATYLHNAEHLDLQKQDAIYDESLQIGAHSSERKYQQSKNECASDIVGTIEVSVRRRPLAATRSQYVYLANLATRPDYRRQGVASQLLEACEVLTRRWGFQDIYLHVLEDNVGARSLYQKLGYHIKQSDADLITWLLGRPRQLLLHKQLSK